jgi:hypothetical protein
VRDRHAAPRAFWAGAPVDPGTAVRVRSRNRRRARGALTLCAGVAIAMFWTAFASARIIASDRFEAARNGEN